eukprot:6209240-Pleurochrysis_carterae.AAC.2
MMKSQVQEMCTLQAYDLFPSVEAFCTLSASILRSKSRDSAQKQGGKRVSISRPHVPWKHNLPFESNIASYGRD